MNVTYDKNQLQETHLDAMIRLAFDLEDIEHTEPLADSADPALTHEQTRLAEEAYFLAISRAEKQNKPHNLLTAARKAMPWVMNIAACIIILLAIAAPVALANSSTFRAKVMQLLVEFDNEKGEAYFSFVTDDSASFDVPERWPGNYYPSYIPDGFIIYDYDPDFGAIIELRNEAIDQLFFNEYDENWDMMAGTEGSVIRNVDINGATGVLIEGYATDGKTWTVTITWQNDTNWFCVTTFGLPTDEALHIARSVKHIVK